MPQAARLRDHQFIAQLTLAQGESAVLPVRAPVRAPAKVAAATEGAPLSRHPPRGPGAEAQEPIFRALPESLGWMIDKEAEGPIPGIFAAPLGVQGAEGHRRAVLEGAEPAIAEVPGEGVYIAAESTVADEVGQLSAAEDRERREHG